MNWQCASNIPARSCPLSSGYYWVTNSLNQLMQLGSSRTIATQCLERKVKRINLSNSMEIVHVNSLYSFKIYIIPEIRYRNGEFNFKTQFEFHFDRSRMFSKEYFFSSSQTLLVKFFSPIPLNDRRVMWSASRSGRRVPAETQNRRGRQGNLG